MWPVAFVVSIREDRNTPPPLKLYSGYVCSGGYVTVFLHLYDLGRKERHKATTRNGAPQKKYKAGFSVTMYSLNLWYNKTYIQTDLLHL